MIETSTITCPQCGHQASERMPADACQFFYDCKGCGARPKPKAGDCCVFCSYGSAPCPPIQAARAGAAAACCAPLLRQADWLASARTNAVAWLLPQAAMVAALLAPVPLRATVWAAALAWMGSACILNARRCGRTHCRYTGPYYLAMIAPVIVAGTGVVPLGFYGWTALGVVILGGSKVIWFATERAWGTFSPR
jgi:hypothetical protein